MYSLVWEGRDHITILHSSSASVSSSTSLAPTTTSSVTKTSTATSPTASASSAASPTGTTTATSLAGDVLLYHVYDLVGDSEILDGAAPDVTLRHPPELVSVPAGADHLPQVDVHPVVAGHEVSVVCLTILQFN